MAKIATSLTSFLRVMSCICYVSTGHCKVDQTEKGWFIQYIDRDPETIERQKVT